MVEFSRRALLKLAAGSGGALAAGLGIKKVGYLVPLMIPNEDIKPGTWVHYPTTCRECPAGCGLHMRHRDGRATKAEGNPTHPVNAGGLCALGQSCVQGLYDPDRVKKPLIGNVDSTWQAAMEPLVQKLADGWRVAIVSDLQTGGLAEVMSAFAAAFGGPKPLFFEPVNFEALRQAHGELLGQPTLPRYRLDHARFILSLGGDFLESGFSPVEHAHGFVNTREIVDFRPVGQMVYVGPRLSMTAANADRFVQCSPPQILAAATAMLREILDNNWQRCEATTLAAARRLVKDAPIVDHLPDGLDAARLAKAFAQADGAVALAGPAVGQGALAHDLATAALLLTLVVNESRQTSKPVLEWQAHAMSNAASDAELSQALDHLDDKTVLLIHDANLAYARPHMAEKLKRAGMRVYLGTLPDETAELADVVLPIDSPLESWGDYEPYADLCCLQQPTTARLHDTRNGGDILLALADAAGKPLTDATGRRHEEFKSWLRVRWTRLMDPQASVQSDVIQEALRQGVIELPTKPQPLKVREDFKPRFLIHAMGSHRGGQADANQDGDETVPLLWVYPSPILRDGRGSNRPWLQETPDPTTSIVWGSWLDAAAGWTHSDGKVVRLSPIRGASADRGWADLTVRITNDVARSVMAAALGQGHWARGLKTACGKGANLFALLSGGDGQVRLEGLPGSGEPLTSLATRDQHHRELVQWIGAGELASAGRPRHYHLPLAEGYTGGDIIPSHEHLIRWGMVIDLHKCIGCGACAVACQAENNVPVVGPQEVRNGREMAWMKIAAYRQDGEGHHGGPARLGFLPMLCQQCDAAPCESVCPVYASVHNEEGLNAQVYNRCIGTRYCANNCPYKARRFNWLDHPPTPPTQMQLNPDVSVRTRGVMEKCTFCIQRIREVQHRAKRHGRAVGPEEVQPACAQSCPTRAIVFGDLMDKRSRVRQLMLHNSRRYQVLGELNTKAAVVYLKRVTIES